MKLRSRLRNCVRQRRSQKWENRKNKVSTKKTEEEVCSLTEG